MVFVQGLDLLRDNLSDVSKNWVDKALLLTCRLFEKLRDSVSSASEAKQRKERDDDMQIDLDLKKFKQNTPTGQPPATARASGRNDKKDN